MKKLLPTIILIMITSCGSTKSKPNFLADEKFELCTQLKYERLITKYYPNDEKRTYQRNIHKLFEDFLLQEKYLTTISKEGYSELLDKVKQNKLKPEFFEKFNKELGFEPYFLFPIASHYSCYDLLIEQLKIVDKSSWQYHFRDAYYKYEASGDLSSDNNYIHDALRQIPYDKFQKITYRKLFLDLIYVQGQR